jgi:hypothetical protein
MVNQNPKMNEIKGWNKILWGEKDISPFPSKGNQAWNIPKVPTLDPSIGHQARWFHVNF